jgi:hypothetical protein
MSNAQSKVQNLTNVGRKGKVGKEAWLVNEHANMFIIIICLLKKNYMEYDSHYCFN